MHVQVVRGQGRRLRQALLHFRGLAALGVRRRLQNQGHRQRRQPEATRRPGTVPRRGEAVVGPELFDQAGGDLQVEGRDQRQGADLDRQLAGLPQPVDALGAQLVDRAEFVQRTQSPQRQAVGVGHRQRAGERGLRRRQVALAGDPSKHLQRLARDGGQFGPLCLR